MQEFPASAAAKPVNTTSRGIKHVRALQQEKREAALQKEEERMAAAAKAANVDAFRCDKEWQGSPSPTM